MTNNSNILFQSIKNLATDLHSSNAEKRNPKLGGRPPVQKPEEIVHALIWHVLQPQGTLSENLSLMCGKRMSDSSLSERRQSMGVDPWIKASEAVHKEVRSNESLRYNGFRLVGVDGTSFNICNSQTMKKTATKTSYPRGESAFFRIPCAALCDLGTHSSLAVSVGLHNESESILSQKVLQLLASDDLIIADRYYGNGKFVGMLLGMDAKPSFLLRVNSRNGLKLMKRLPDGSSIGTVKDPITNKSLEVREIRGMVRRTGGKWSDIRLWTNLVDPKQFPADEILKLYGFRWEQEIAFGEIKKHLCGKNRLASQTTITAAQEIYALFMAQAVIQSIRQKLGDKSEIRNLEISFQKTMNAVQKACAVIALPCGIISDHVAHVILRTYESQLEWNSSAKRRQRSCPRKVRKPIGNWPCLRNNTYEFGVFEFKAS